MRMCRPWYRGAGLGGENGELGRVYRIGVGVHFAMKPELRANPEEKIVKCHCRPRFRAGAISVSPGNSIGRRRRFRPGRLPAGALYEGRG